MKQTELSYKTLILTVILSFALLLVAWSLMGSYQSSNASKYTILSDGWDLYVNDEVLALDAPIETAVFGKLKRGSTVDMMVTLPEEAGDGYTYQMLVYLCSVEAYVDDELIYSFAADEVDKDEMIGSGIHFIELPAGCGGKQLKIHMKMNENDAYTSLTTPKIIPSSIDYVTFANTEIINIFISFFLFVLGAVLIVVSVVAVFVNPVYVRLIFIGFTSLCVGMWSLCSSKLLQLFSVNMRVNTELEYISLFYATIPVLVLMYIIRRYDGTWRRRVLRAEVIIMSVFCLITTVLHFTNIARFPTMLIPFHIVGGACVIIGATAGFISVKKKSNSEMVMTTALLVFVATIGLDLIRFNVQKYVLPNNELLMNSFIPLGTLVFIIMLLASYLIYLYDMVMSKAEKETLTQLAYHDVLTGLYNRTKYDEDMDILEVSDEEFALINFDVNGLKAVNDAFGHGEGDYMLRSFSRLLTEQFDSIGRCYRMGGDEFLVLVKEDEYARIDQALKKLEEEEKRASANYKFDIEASYGVAYRRDVEGGSVAKLYTLSDKKMYQMKVQCHNSRTYQLNNSEDL